MKTEIKLHFKSDEEAEEFMSQLSDGWGEEYIGLTWKGDFYQARSFNVELLNDEIYEEEVNA